MRVKDPYYLVYQLDSITTSSNLLHPFIDVLYWYTVIAGNHKENIISHTETMPSTKAKTAETTAYELVCATPFTRIHGWPMHHDFETLKKEASDLASKVDNLTFEWCCDPATGEVYVLAEIIGDDEYTHLTNLKWQQEVEPKSYD
jgi:hypothetical protein